jgi:hypothetical protein
MYIWCQAVTTKQANIQKPLMSNSFTNKHVSTARKDTRMRSSVFCAVHAGKL